MYKETTVTCRCRSVVLCRTETRQHSNTDEIIHQSFSIKAVKLNFFKKHARAKK